MPLLLSPLVARCLHHSPYLPAAVPHHPSRPRPLGGEARGGSRGRVAVVSEKQAAAAVAAEKSPGEGSDGERYDAIVVGSGIGGLVAATQLAAKGARVLVLEKYIIPGGSSGYYRRDGFTFDVGSSVMFGFSDKGNLNLITQALEAVGCKMEVIPDPSTVHFHLPGALSVLVHREYNDFIEELVSKFPHEKEGILKFYGTCWFSSDSSERIDNHLNDQCDHHPIFRFFPCHYNKAVLQRTIEQLLLALMHNTVIQQWVQCSSNKHPTRLAAKTLWAAIAITPDMPVQTKAISRSRCLLTRKGS